MAGSRRRRWSCLAAAALQLALLIQVAPARAASALAAWALREDGTLQLRTRRNTRLEAFFQAPSDGRGPRVWIDFPGELRFPRRLAGRGAVREIRLGKPRPGATRLVVEFQPSIRLNPADSNCAEQRPIAGSCDFRGCRPGAWLISGKGT